MHPAPTHLRDVAPRVDHLVAQVVGQRFDHGSRVRNRLRAAIVQRPRRMAAIDGREPP